MFKLITKSCNYFDKENQILLLYYLFIYLTIIFLDKYLMAKKLNQCKHFSRFPYYKWLLKTLSVAQWNSGKKRPREKNQR